VSCRVPSPDDEIDGVLQIGIDPLERLVDQRHRSVALSACGTKPTGVPRAPVTRRLVLGGRVDPIKWVGVEIYADVSLEIPNAPIEDSTDLSDARIFLATGVRGSGQWEKQQTEVLQMRAASTRGPSF